MTKDDRYGATDDTYGDESDGYDDHGATAVETQSPDETEQKSRSKDGASESESNDLPFIFARRTVKADREAVPVYLQSETATEMQDLERTLAERFDGDKIMSLDVREALVQAGLRNIDDVEAVMEEWGYGRR